MCVVGIAERRSISVGDGGTARVIKNQPTDSSRQTMMTCKSERISYPCKERRRKKEKDLGDAQVTDRHKPESLSNPQRKKGDDKFFSRFNFKERKMAQPGGHSISF